MTQRFYFFDEEKKIIWYSKVKLASTQWLTFIGKSDNLNPKVAAAALMQQRSTRVTGCKVREYAE